jgi:hypothetical protein
VRTRVSPTTGQWCGTVTSYAASQWRAGEPHGMTEWKWSSDIEDMGTLVILRGRKLNKK